MRCRNCSAENADRDTVCAHCASPLAPRCPKCGFEYSLGAKFCSQCATPLNLSNPARAAAGARPGPLPAERRHLTVLFCDLVASTALATQLDPEEWRDTLARYHWAATEAIVRFEGHVAQYLGDGVMAYFGWPQAHDNDAERAVRAGLAIHGAIAKLNENPAHAQLAARVGIDSGTVVVGAGAGKDADVFGQTPNIASRVQTAAEPGTVLITDATHRLVAGLFVVADGGVQMLKGVERPVQQYRVVRPSGVRGRLEAAAAAHGLTPFVGRGDESRLLMDRWQRVLGGKGQVALIIGESGIGKSRLVQHFHEQMAGTPHTWAGAAAVPFLQNTPFHPAVEMLHDLLALLGDDDADQPLDQLARALELAGMNTIAAVPLIAPLLNLQLSDKYPRLALSPEVQRSRQLATLVDWVIAAAREQPLVIATEDLHWADPSTLELIQLLVEQGSAARLLLLYTARPEFKPQWPHRQHHTHITLDRLSDRNARTIVEQVAPDGALPAPTIAAVVERTGGVPLFVEELTRAILESGEGRFIGREIPASLHDSLMARLDHLGSAKEVAQAGAVIGGEFSYELLSAIHPIAEDDLQRALHKLNDADMLYVRGVIPEATYQFKHALVRDAAYGALLKSRRKELHRLVARTIDEQFTALKEMHPEVLARHWTEAGEIRPAIAEWFRAGKSAQARNAFKEALESYQQAVAVLNLMPKSPEDESFELELGQSVVAMLYVTRGFAAPETIAAVENAVALAEKSGNVNQMVNWLTSRSSTLLISGELSAAAAMLDRTLELTARHRNPLDLGPLYQLLTITRYWRGDLEAAEKHYAAGLAFFQNERFKQPPLVTVTTFGFGSMNAWMLGRPALARERAEQMMAAAELGSPFDLANAEYFAARIELYMRDYERAEALALRALERAEKHNIPNPAARA
ncbi:MAG: AAA family ATPase, partial [Candidatus Binataceae bacterium]